MGGGIAQQLKVLASQPDDTSFTPDMSMVEEENQYPQIVL